MKPKSLPRFFPTLRQNLIVVVLCLAGIISLVALDSRQGGVPAWHEVLTVLFGAISAIALTLVYQDRRASAMVRDLQSALKRIKPSYSSLNTAGPFATGTEGLENEIRTLTEQWTAFCHHCQSTHDSEMVQAEHLATVGELAAGLAHEIRNPLAGIAGAIEIVSKDFPKDHPDRHILNDLHLEVRRIEKTLNELLAYARPKPPQFGPSDIKETIARTVQLAQQQTGNRRVDFSVRISPALPTFLVDAGQIQQVLLNLALNSVQSIEDEGEVRIEAGLREGEPPEHAAHVEISVSDTGEGISREEIDRVFRPFYTTKRGGTGLGLSLCRRIVDAHGGTLVAESELGKGSRFTIRLPLRKVSEELLQISLR